MTRMPGERLWETNVRGRPRKMLNEEIAKVLKSAGSDWKSAASVAKDRKKQKKFIKKQTSL